jgi:hypothetical protein
MGRGATNREHARSRIRFSASTVSVPHRQRSGMSILWIIIIVVLVLAVLGFFGRGRF